MITALLYLCVGLFVAMVTTPWVIALAQRGFGMDHADELRKSHGHAVPRLGGAPIMLAVSLGLFGIFTMEPRAVADWLPVLVGSVLMYALGLWDDLARLDGRTKLVAQLLIALLVFQLGLRIERVSYPGGGWPVDLGAWALPVTVLWLIALPNIVNLIDGFDGLAGGLGLFMALTLGIVGLISEQQPVAWFAFTIAGALLGFLVFNFPPARIYLGDGGAYLIGFAIAALSLTSSHKGSVATVLLVTVVTLGLPILDTLFAVARRALRGFPLFHADDEHIHHLAQTLGFSKRRVLVAIYGVAVVLSLIALSIFWSQGRTLPIAIGFVFLLAIIALRYLHLIRTIDDAKLRIARVFSRRPTVRYALLQAQLLELEVDRCRTQEEFWQVFDNAIQRVGFLGRQGANGALAFPLHLPYKDGQQCVLFAPHDVGTEVEWRRLAECFRPAFLKAARRWKTPAP